MSTHKVRGRFSSLDGKTTSEGMNPNELWGVAQRDLGKPRRKRSAEAVARRRAKKAAKRAKVALKAWLRKK
jgi:hypothetical protein